MGALRLQRGKGVCGSIPGNLGFTFSICEMGPLPCHPLTMVFIEQRVLNVGGFPGVPQESYWLQECRECPSVSLPRQDFSS